MAALKSGLPFPVFTQWRRRIAAGASFFAGLASAAWLLARCFPFESQVSSYAAKAAQFGAHRDEYNTLFIGSSRVHEQIDPVVFDRSAREAGMKTHSFNYGFGAMEAPEDGFVCERIFAMRPKRLRWVFIEVNLIFEKARGLTEPSARVVCWHDFSRTMYLCRQLWPRFEKPKTTTPIRRARHWVAYLNSVLVLWPTLALHMQYLLMRWANLGTGAAWLGLKLSAETRDAPAMWLGERLNGYLTPRYQPVAADLVRYADELTRLRDTPVRVEPLPPLSEESLAGMLRQVRAVGAEPVLLICPTTSPLKLIPKASATARLLDFSDEKRWPELFRIECRRDINHLNEAGAEIFSRDLALEWVRQMKADAKPLGATTRQ